MASTRRKIRYIAWSQSAGACEHQHLKAAAAADCVGDTDRQVVAVDVAAAERDRREVDRVRRGGALRGRLYYEVEP